MGVEDVYVELDGVPILRGVCLNVERGETVILLGRNGAGKTTTMRSVMRIVPIKSGRIMFEGRDITGLKTHDVARMGIGYAPEDRKIFTDLT
ncbi:MAG: ABC transporter ATP-binding protein, partial [Thermoprotei archaeon]